jgi:murein DD-endopeptidase MepM/ murein hydrolase activator NlpD
MLSVKATAMVSLVAALATVSIAAFVRGPDKVRLVPGANPATAALVPVGAKAPPGDAEADELRALSTRHLLMPVKGFDPKALRDNFDEARGIRRHEALDIMSARGTPVVAADDGTIEAFPQCRGRHHDLPVRPVAEIRLLLRAPGPLP